MAVLQGMDQLLRAIREATADIQEHAEGSAREAASALSREIKAVYEAHRSSTDTYTADGRRRARRHLADHVATTRKVGRGYAAYRVVVDAPHAYIFEHGTDERAWKTRGGRSTGRMWRKGVLLRVAPEERQQMVDRIVANLRTLGFEVKL